MSSAEKLFTLVRGTTPLLINVPHAGTYIPLAIRQDLSVAAQGVPDTDWHVQLLYEFALALGASLMVATHSRYVIDLNRDPGDVSLYPGVDTTELCPTRTFANDDIYRSGQAPNFAALNLRRADYWTPYHQTLAATLMQIKQTHGYAILLDAHSIRAQVPRFFAGTLPDLNLGTADGASCDSELQIIAHDVLQSAAGFSMICNGRFKGGYITRHYGQPQARVHALQLEIAQSCYMDERAPYAWEPTQAASLIALLARLVRALKAWAPRGAT